MLMPLTGLQQTVDNSLRVENIRQLYMSPEKPLHGQEATVTLRH